MNRYFSFNRFVKLLKYDMVLHKKKYLFFTLVMFLVLFFVSYYWLDDNYKIRALNMSEYRYSRKLNQYQVFCIFCYLVLSTLVVSTSFSFFRTKEGTSNYLTLPVSTLEKFLSEFLVRIVIFNIVFLVSFWLSFKLASYAFTVYFSNYQGTSYQLVDIPNFGILEQFTFYRHLLDRNVAVLTLFSLTTFSLAGASYFNKYALFKNILAFATLVLFAYVVTLITYHLILPKKVDVFNVNIISRELNKDYEVSHIVLYSIGALSSLFLLPFAYFKLKEKEL